jgi:hypothetical protein
MLKKKSLTMFIPPQILIKKDQNRKKNRPAQVLNPNDSETSAARWQFVF